MKQQIARARMFYHEGEKGMRYLNQASKWPVRHACLLIFHTKTCSLTLLLKWLIYLFMGT